MYIRLLKKINYDNKFFKKILYYTIVVIIDRLQKLEFRLLK